MNQDYFRALLATNSNDATQENRSFLPTSGWVSARNPNASSETMNSSQPAFRPRKVKKKGAGSEVTQSRTINLDEYEELGSAKGLDMSLLNKRTTNNALLVDDEVLEQIFANKEGSQTTTEARIQPSVPKKRTREEIVNELKRKRSKQDSSTGPSTSGTLTDSRFKPIGCSVKQVQKKLVKGISKKKPSEPTPVASKDTLDLDTIGPCESYLPPTEKSTLSAKPTMGGEESDVDIFTGVGEYDDLGVGSSSSESDDQAGDRGVKEEYSSKPTKSNWFNDLEGAEVEEINHSPDLTLLGQRSEPSNTALVHEPSPQERLVPLASSSIGSISLFLDIDRRLEAEEKRKARRQKKKGKRQE